MGEAAVKNICGMYYKKVVYLFLDFRVKSRGCIFVVQEHLDNILRLETFENFGNRQVGEMYIFVVVSNL